MKDVMSCNSIFVHDYFFVHCLNNCIHDYDTSTLMFFVNNYSVFVLSVTHMAFSGLHDVDPSDPSVLVLHDRHRSHLVDTKHVCILLNITNITYHWCNVYIINSKFVNLLYL